MIDPITTPGKTYAVTSPNGCTVTQHVGEVDIVTDVPAGLQTLIIAHASKFEIDDDSAIVTECGGSAELVFTAATTRAASSGTGSDGMTAEERALLNGAAQRDADNTFSAGNTFTGAVDMSAASVTPPEGWNVGELTPEEVQSVVPMAWSDFETLAECKSATALAIGDGAKANAQMVYGTNAGAIAIGEKALCGGQGSVVIGRNAKDTGSIGSVVLGQAAQGNSMSVAAGMDSFAQNTGTVAVGYNAKANGYNSVCAGSMSTADGKFSTALGGGTTSQKDTSITLGSKFTETTSSGNVTHTCTTQGTGSITIGAGANTLNNGDTESSNSVTIGCKASNQGADTVVIGAQAKATAGGTVAIGAGAEAADAGAVVFASYSTDRSYKTQLYFSGAGSALANAYAGGEGIMGYVTTDSAGNVIASGYKKLSALFDEGSMTQPATLNEFGDWVTPKVFQPGTLPQQEYTPLPVYPIVEPEIPEMEEV